MMNNPRRVLIADDEGLIALLLLEIFNSDGWVATIVRDGHELYALMTSGMNRYDLIVTDINMPEWNGIEGTRMAQAFGVDTPILYITGHVGDCDIPKEKILHKPFTSDQLLEKIKSTIDIP